MHSTAASPSLSSVINRSGQEASDGPDGYGDMAAKLTMNPKVLLKDKTTRRVENIKELSTGCAVVSSGV